ncbi:MAG: efflux RND transporter periplasmic adaptor subunit [Mangrovicoccus sp.]|nr:efflux RND transporter periplasmic adaptor subunit [Mangrovicoccus sp.]
MTTPPIDHAKPAKRRWIWILFAALLVALAGSFIFLLEDTADVTQAEHSPPLPPVPVQSVSAGPAQAEIRSFAQIRPLWAADLRANIGGVVIEVSDQALAGRRVAKGDVLLRLEDSGLQADLSRAEQSLAEARLALRQAQNRTELRRREAARAGNSAPSDLNLLLPELRVAERAVGAGESQVAAAKAALRYAVITAPFDGFVTARNVSPGQSVAPGDMLLSLVDRQRFELETGLSDRQWALLSHPVAGQKVQVESLDGTPLAQARIRDAGGFRDPETREFKLFLEITEAPETQIDAPLLTGDLVQLVFTGITMPRALRLPEAALTREGHIWHVDDQDRLARLDADLLWQAAGDVVLRAPERLDHLRIATTPLAGFHPGSLVAPQQGAQ